VHIVANKYTPFIEQAFANAGSLTLLGTLDIRKESVRDADALIVRSETRVNRDLLEGSAVRYVGTVTIGTDHVDKEYLAQKEIAFASAPGSNSNSVAEYIASALLTLARRHHFSLKGKTLGVVGVGNVGSKVVRVAHALGMDVVENDPPLQRETGDARFRPLSDILDCDFVTLHVPLQKQGPDVTYHLFDDARMSKMKPASFLLNSSRGAVVCGDALMKALKQKNLAGAVLDVWEKEPAINMELLRSVDIGTPHIAGYSLDGKVNAVRMIHASLSVFFSLPLTWDIDRLLPPADVPIIHAEENESLDSLVARAVRSCYDIELDDRNLRATESTAPDERGYAFMKLRAEYRIRREFPQTTVYLRPETESAAGILRQLGFSVIT
jgi:erythronate-4-phosphate dehydrogenase